MSDRPPLIGPYVRRKPALPGKTCSVCELAFTPFKEAQTACAACGPREGTLRRKYGMTPQDWRDMFDRLGEACALCHADLKGKRTCTDHDHATGRVRGILCSSCNSGLGKLGDTGEALERAQAYLLSHRDLLGELLAA